ncbi:cytochrome P450 [Xylariaceae sp. FL0804]|nr:cytochrome P450 [Xylariaceae sp. FL0804]
MNSTTPEAVAGGPDFAALKAQLYHAVGTASLTQTVAVVAALYWLAAFVASFRRERPKAPVHGYRSVFEPTIVLQARFAKGARKMIEAAYEKSKNFPFVLRRFDVDFMVLPHKYLEEIRLVSGNKLSSRSAQVGNLVPEWTGMDFLKHSDLHVKVLKNKLIPELYKYTDLAQVELAYGWHLDVPQSDEWTEVFIEHILRMLVARMTAKVFMGSPVCRDPEWLRISIDFSVDLFTTAFTMKLFPPWMYPFVAYLIPARYRTKRQLAQGRKLVGSLMREHEQARRGGVPDQDTLLNWMLDHGTPAENELGEMAARQCVLTLASIHTTASSTSNLVYDLCDHPEWIPVLREEIDAAIKDLGKPGENPDVSAKEWCTRLDKMDSFFRESQRHHPVLLLGPQRLAMETITLKDGVRIPEGTRLTFAMRAHMMDPATYPDPQAFDPMRSYRRRMSGAPDERFRHLAGQVTADNLAFGYGNQACAGRQFAVAEIKLIMARLLYEFDFEFPAGKARPHDMYVNENTFTDPAARVMMRKRRT